MRNISRTLRSLIFILPGALPCIGFGAENADLFSNDDHKDHEKYEDHDEANDLEQYEAEFEASLTLTIEDYDPSPPADISDELPQPGAIAEFELTHLFNFQHGLDAFIALSLNAEKFEYATQPGTINNEFAQLNELWAQWSLPTRDNMLVRGGRQTINDGTGWWWDDELNAISAFGLSDRIRYQVALGRQNDAPRISALPEDPELDDIYWALASLQFNPDENKRVRLLLASRTDQSSTPAIGQTLPEALIDERDDELYWLGLHWQQIYDNIKGHGLSLTLDAALMTGELDRLELENDGDDVENSDEPDDASEDNDTEEDVENELQSDYAMATVSGNQTGSVNAWAFWASIRWTPAFSLNHSVSLGYAFGSGTRKSSQSGSGTFQQTGLHSNEQTFHHLGKVLDPDLANLHVATLQLAGVLSQHLRYRVSHNRYFRDSRQDDTFETDIDLELNDTQNSLGRESAVAINVELIDGMEAELSYALYATGPGITTNNKTSFSFVEFEISYEF